nr:hypothetical protein [Candidatus Woesearchaeota archaeon]
MQKLDEIINSKLNYVLNHPYYSGKHTITPKKFIVEKIYSQEFLTFEEKKEYSLSGILMTQREVGWGRTFFYPYKVYNNPSRFIEVKGYGQDGQDMCLWLHSSNDILFGTFFKKAEREYLILEKAFNSGLNTPMPLLLGRIYKEEWLKSGLKVASSIILSRSDSENNLENRFSMSNLDLLEEYLKAELDLPISKNPLGAFKQDDDAGFIIRAPLSPFRLGDPEDKYKLNERIIEIAKTAGKTFYKLIELGYLHLCPSTGNITTAGELTDLADCYDLKEENNLEEVIEDRENNIKIDFWQDLIGPRHLSNLSPLFIEGMFGSKLSLVDASKELEAMILT